MKRVLLPRPAGDDVDAALLRERGFDVVSDPYISVQFFDDSVAVQQIIDALRAGAALALTSSRGLQSIEKALFAALDVAQLRAFAVGPTTAAACRAAGIRDVVSPDSSFNTQGLLELLAEHRPTSIAVPRSGASADSFLSSCQALGIAITAAVTYDTRTVQAEPVSAPALRAGAFDAVVVRSGSAARALAHFVPQWPRETKIVASGEATARVLAGLAMPVAITSQDSTSFSLADAVAAILG